MSAAHKPIDCAGNCGKSLISKSKNASQGRRCADCKRAYMREWWSSNKATHDSGRWAKANRGSRRLYMAGWREAHREQLRRYDRRYARGRSRELRKIAVEIETLCGCGERHTVAQRAVVLGRLRGAPLNEIREAWPCIWGSPAGERKLYRDLKRIQEAA